MKSTKRLITATISGLLFGLVCFSFASSGTEKLAWPIIMQIISSRTLIGLAIGISRFPMKHWSIHGLVMGFLFSLPLAFSGLMAQNPDFSHSAMFISTVVMGMIYGFLIEVITSVLLKAKA
jgi:hypothetical protein